jgi:hypothetical protein
MSALPNVLTTQSAPRLASLAVPSDGTPKSQGQKFTQNQSFAETVLHQSNNQTSLDISPAAKQRQVHPAERGAAQTLSLSNISPEDSDVELSADELNVEGLNFGTDTIVDSKVKIDDHGIAEIQTPSPTLTPSNSNILTPHIEGSDLDLRRTSTHQAALATPETQTTARTEISNSLPQGADLNQQIGSLDRTDLPSRLDLQTTVTTAHPQAGTTPLSRTEHVGDQRILPGDQVITPDTRVLETIQTGSAFVDNAAPQTNAAQVTNGQTAQNSPNTPAPTTPSQADAQTPMADKNDRPLLYERAAETAEYRAAVKTAAPEPNLAKIIDAPSSPTTLLASNDGPTLLKSTPIFTVTPTLTPISGMSDRLAGTILQTTNAQPAVTMDKLPQAVVAIALSAKRATLQIDPPELGRIQLDYQFDTQGRTVVTLTPESDAARAALMDRMAVITAALEQGSSSPIDVKLGDARDFGSEFGQASQDGDNSGSESGLNDGSNGSSSNITQNTDLQRFTRAPAGEPDRLHILV